MKKLVFIIVLVLAIYITWSSLIEIFIIRSNSMLPTLDDGNIVFALKKHSYQINDIVILRNPVSITKEYIVKRIKGCTNDTITLTAKNILITHNSITKKYNNFMPTQEHFTFILTTEHNIFSSIPYYFIKYSEFDNAIDTTNQNLFFILGDNSGHSIDSRYFGAVTQTSIIGKVIFRIWPMKIF